jgi:hypothetical protein
MDCDSSLPSRYVQQQQPAQPAGMLAQHSRAWGRLHECPRRL